ncbi:hypothetical protein BDV96DRAFT_576915 [Lophiotrema nucula]|uniref:Uncharacterized protein n=1 Tax=Lophiotrema nucula TaxID=690887 RepID=A0A6A5Z644_9PLEO|nr:hypothetical protein BDV96DRAFT_576915 [Lophiotrema nucula]
MQHPGQRKQRDQACKSQLRSHRRLVALVTSYTAASPGFVFFFLLLSASVIAKGCQTASHRRSEGSVAATAPPRSLPARALGFATAGSTDCLAVLDTYTLPSGTGIDEPVIMDDDDNSFIPTVTIATLRHLCDSCRALQEISAIEDHEAA